MRVREDEHYYLKYIFIILQAFCAISTGIYSKCGKQIITNLVPCVYKNIYVNYTLYLLHVYSLGIRGMSNKYINLISIVTALRVLYRTSTDLIYSVYNLVKTGTYVSFAGVSSIQHANYSFRSQTIIVAAFPIKTKLWTRLQYNDTCHSKDTIPAI